MEKMLLKYKRFKNNLKLFKRLSHNFLYIIIKSASTCTIRFQSRKEVKIIDIRPLSFPPTPSSIALIEGKLPLWLNKRAFFHEKRSG